MISKWMENLHSIENLAPTIYNSYWQASQGFIGAWLKQTPDNISIEYKFTLPWE